MEARDLTVAVHAGASIEETTGAVMPPIFQTSTYVQSEPGKPIKYDYSRGGNPTRSGYEKALSELEMAKYALSFSSGLAAEQAIIQTLSPGDEVVVCDDVYGGTGRLFRTLFAKYGIIFHFVDMCDLGAVKKVISLKTKLFWLESPTNPTLKIIDIKEISNIAKENRALLVVDNTFATPIFQKPLNIGADIVIHSTTKYIGGHSDMIGGALMVNDDKLYESLHYVQFAAGAIPSPFECFLLHRSIKTLAVRLKQHEKNAIKVANFLADHSKVKELFYPGHKSHLGHEVAKKQMTGFSGMLSFRLNGSYDDVKAFFRKLKIFCLAESLGGVESLANHPEKMTHASVPEELRKKLGIDANLIRLSVGIESSEDILLDIAQALN